jgi:hypothetical protein
MPATELRPAPSPFNAASCIWTKGEESDITELLLKQLKEWRKLKHKRYHVPLEGAKVFIRAWQQVNGRENQLGIPSRQGGGDVFIV